MGNISPAEALANSHETIGSRETYYIPVSLFRDPLFCGDDRGLLEAYIQLFGGIINVAYNHAILEDTNQPGSVRDSLEDRVGTLTAQVLEKGMHPGVHSDAKTEQGDTLRHSIEEGDVGCAYALLRAPISVSIAHLGEGLVEETSLLMPELFQKPEDYEHGIAVTKAHGRLAKLTSFQAPGRKLVLTAISNGAKAVVLGGEHVASDGILNTVRNTTFDSKSAERDGLPAYNHDIWAASAIAEELGTTDPSELHRLQIANAIDARGTLHALGVEAIAVRR
jgi:hypothetical protein